MEVKILCPCGAKYKFDVEPLNGRLPGPVSCPVCSADGTALGNEIVARSLSEAAQVAPVSVKPISIPVAASAQPSRSGFVAPAIPKSSKDVQPAAVAPSAPVASPAPTAAPIQVTALRPQPAAPAVAPAAGAPRLSVQAVHAAPAATNESSAPVPTPPPASRRDSPTISEPSLTRGLIGIGVASFVGLLIWFAITLFLGAKFKWAAIGIGALIGWTGHWLGKQKSQTLGIAAATATALVMIIGVLWSARHEAYLAVNETLDIMWEEQVAYAKEAVTASRTDDQLRTFLEKNGLGPEDVSLESEDDDEDSSFLTVSASSSHTVDARTLTDFKKNELPKLRKFAEGKTSKSQFERENRPALETIYTAGFIFARAFKIKMLVLIGLAIGAAWKFTAA